MVFDMMFVLKKIALFPISLFVAFLALMAKWLLTLSSYVVAPLMLSPTYRLPKTVTAVRIYRDESIFSVCPRCDVCIEREYQGYCHQCGQYLDWSKLEDAEEIFIGWSGVEDDDD